MRRLGILFIVLLFLFGIPTGLLFFSPTTLITPVANYYLIDLGFRLTDLEQLELGLNGSQASGATIRGTQFDIEIQDIALGYSVAGLRRGQLPSLTVGQLVARLDSSEQTDSGSGSNFSLANLLGAVGNSPVNSIRIENITLGTGSSAYQIGLELETQPVSLTGQLQLSGTPALQLQLNTRQSGPATILGDTRLNLGDKEAIAAEFTLSSSEQIAEISASSTLSLNVLTAIPAIEELLGPVTLFGDVVQAEGSFVLDFSATALLIPQFALSIDAPNSILQFDNQSTTTASELQIQSPISITGVAEPSSGGLYFSVSDLNSTLSLTTAGRDIEVDANFSALFVQCQESFSCQLNSQFAASNQLFDLGALQLENSTVEGNLILINNNGRVRAAIPLATIRLPEINSEFASSNLEVVLESVAISYAQELSAIFPFHSNSLELGIGADGSASLWQGVELSNSSIEGEIFLASDQISMQTDLLIRGQPFLSGTANHQLLDQSGSVELNLLEYYFSNITPFSSFLSSLPIEAELIAGKVAGEAEISWTKNNDSTWNIGGPLSLSMEDLGGFYNDVFFVDLSTKLNAIIGEENAIRSSEKLSATIAKLDIGLPIENIRWQYEFDTGTGEYILQDLRTELLGGGVSIPEFSFQPQSDENILTVVLDNLELNTIADLAEYPGVYVDGLISGYLPVAVGVDKITIEKGLIGALNPGGTIRYTPANPIPSANAGIQLVNDALSNYQYEIMNTEVDYEENGDLLLGIQLQGSNPDMNNGQQINLNINITDNIPTLLRSLQASRVITEALEQSLDRGN
jgi:hypothetical protein